MHLFRCINTPILSAVFLVVLLLQSCPTQPPDDPPEPGLLSVEYTTATEVWLRIQVPDTARQAGVQLYRNDSLVANFPAAPPDTVVIDTGLQPNTTCAYHTIRLTNGTEESPSEPLKVTTLPTTSHNFTWTIDTLGAYGSYLKDVAIVDEDNIWVVGNIRVPDPDSSFNGTGWKEYNAARWNGDQWHLMGIYSNTLNLYSIQYFAEDDIWVTDYGFPIHWDGQKWTLYHLQNMGINASAGNAIWGSAPDDVYFVGSGGSIVHYDGSGFERMESGTNIPLLDIYGTSTNNLWAGGRDYEHYTGSVLLRNVDAAWKTISSLDIQTRPTQITGPLVSVWSDTNVGLYVLTPEGIFRVSGSNQTTTLLLPAPGVYWNGFPYRMRGTGINDVFVVGEKSRIWHFNGVSLNEFAEVLGDESVRFRHIAVSNDIICVVGTHLSTGKAIIVRGYR